jgi:hypothetical protein
MEKPLSFCLLISRNVLAGFLMGVLFGGAYGFLFPSALLVMAWIASVFQGMPTPPDASGIGVFVIFGGFIGGGLGLIAGGFYGLLLGCINGLIMSLVTQLWFVPLTDVTVYERVMRGCTVIVTTVGTICAIALTFGSEFLLLYGIVPALLFGLGAGPVSKRLIRPYLTQARPIGLERTLDGSFHKGGHDSAAACGPAGSSRASSGVSRSE